MHSADDTWYRARIRRANPARKEADVVYVDCQLALYLSPFFR